MGIIAETPTWEPTIYSLETTDPVEGGVTGISNRSRIELANRTAQIREVLKKHGIEVNPADNIGFTGQWIDPDPTFEGSVVDSDVVYYNIGNARYEKALADGTVKQHFVGVADVTNSKVIGGGFLGNPVISGAPAQGDIIYLSDTTPGQMTTVQTPISVGKWLFTNTMILNAGVGGAGGAGDYQHEQDTYRMLLENSFYKNGFFDNLLDDSFITHNMEFDFGQNLLDFTVGEQMTTGNLKDPLVSLTIAEAFLSVDITDSGSTTFEMSADGGSNWETVSNNAIHVFSNTGSDLRVRITGGGTGTIEGYAVMYNPEDQLRPVNITSIPSGEIILFESDVAVLGYTMKVDQDDQLVYISSGGAAGIKPGSTWTQPGHVLTEAEMPSHKHDARDGQGGDRTNSITAGGGNFSGQDNTNVWRSSDTYTLIRETGGDQPHDHGSTWRPRGRNYTRQEKI